VALTHETAVRNTIADAVVDLIDALGYGGQLIILDGAVTLATFTLASPAFGDSASGAATAGAIAQVDASASGEADGFKITDAVGTTIFSGTVTLAGSGGDVELSNVNLIVGDPIAIDLLTYTAPA